MKPAFVLGIDGLPFTLARRLIDNGIMPNLESLAARGSLAQMDTTIPDFSCVAWTSFATGVNPGNHGIYGFHDFHPRNGESFVPDARYCKASQLWHQVGDAGGRSVILNLPGTYPATPLRGKLVSGFVAPEFAKACYPMDFADTLQSMGYRMDLDGIGGLGSPQHVKKNINPVFKARKDVIRHIIGNEQWDLCISVITETDRIQHFYRHALEDESQPEHQWIKHFFIALDSFIGEVADMLEGRADLYLVSDHGFDVVKKDIILQDLLQQLGLAYPCTEKSWQNPEAAAKSKVFTLDPGRFYINREDSRFASGFVKESEVEDILNTLGNALLELRDDDTGEQIVSCVKTKQQGFWGSELQYAPDLVAATKPGYYFKSYKYPEDSNVTEMKWEANHVWNDAIFYTPYKIDEARKPVIWDILPTVLQTMGIPITANVDGRFLHQR